MGYTIRIPGAVYEDFLDPATSGMEAEIELPTPSRRRQGRGYQYVYEGITAEQASEIADYFILRGELLLAQGYPGMSEDPDEMRARNTYRAAIRTAQKIRAQVGA